MDSHFYYKTLRKTILAFLDLFNGIQVAKYNKDGNIAKYVEVPIKFMPKQKFYEFVHRHSHAKRLPIMSAEITSMDYDESRKTGKHENIYVTENDDNLSYYITPSPYNVEFQLKIATEYMVEMEQIASQILPFFDPFVYVTLEIDELQDKWNIPILLNSIDIDQESEIGEDEKRKILWTFSFTAKTYMSKPVGDVPLVKKIIQKIYTSNEGWSYRNDTETESPSGIGHDNIEYFTKGTKDNDGKILVSYEVFEND